MSGGWGVGRWADLVSLFRSETRFEGTDASQFRLVFRGGKQIVCAKQIEHYYGLAELVQRYVHRKLLPLAQGRLARTEPVEFGAVTLHPTKLALNQMCAPARECSFDEIRHIEVAGGHLLINQTTERAGSYLTLKPIPGAIGGTFAIPLSEVANYTVLFVLLPVKPVGWDPTVFDE